MIGTFFKRNILCRTGGGEAKGIERKTGMNGFADNVKRTLYSASNLIKIVVLLENSQVLLECPHYFI